MYSIANKFYQGSLNKFGFGTWDSVNPPMLTIKSPYTPKPAGYNNYNNITTLPAITRSNTYHNENTEMNTRNSNRNSAMTEHMKLNIMEDRIRRLNNRLESESNQQRYYPSQLHPNSNNTNHHHHHAPVNTNMIITEPNNPPIAMVNDVYSKEREERRKYIQNEIRLAKMKLNNEKLNTSGNSIIHCNCNSTNESFRPKKKPKLQIQTEHKEPTHIPSHPMITNMAQPIERIELCTCPKRTKDVKAYEKEKFIHRMPPHIALKLQKENFKTRSAMESVFHRYNSIYEDYESKLKQLELRQYINFQKLRNVLEYAGNKRIKGAVERYIDGENINLNALKEEAQDYLRDFPFVMDGKIVIHENKRKPPKKEEIEEEEEEEEEDNEESEDDEEILPENVIMPEFNNNENAAQNNGRKGKGNKDIRRMQRAACGTTVIIPNLDNMKELQQQATQIYNKKSERISDKYDNNKNNNDNDNGESSYSFVESSDDDDNNNNGNKNQITKNIRLKLDKKNISESSSINEAPMNNNNNKKYQSSDEPSSHAS